VSDALEIAQALARDSNVQIASHITDVSLGTSLSPRLEQTLRLLLFGLAEKQVALRLGISKHTVHVYVKKIYRLIGVDSRSELMAHFLAGSLSEEQSSCGQRIGGAGRR